MTASAPGTVRSALQRFDARAHLFTPASRLLVAYSGGQDSATLLHAVCHLTPRPAFVAAVHVDHALRPESADQAREVQHTALEIGADVCAVRRVDVPALHLLQKRWSIEQTARALRYQALASGAVEFNADAVLVAHTADDQAETVLLNLLRGTGLEGLAGMPADEQMDLAHYGSLTGSDLEVTGVLRVARPLLSVPREITGAYCAECRLPVVVDPSNASRVHTRNRVRMDLLPLLRGFNPAAPRVLARLADLAAEDSRALRWWTEDAFGRLASRAADDQGEGWQFRLAEWHPLPRGSRRRLLRRAIQLLAGSLRDVPSAPIEDALDLLEQPYAGPRHYDLSGGVYVALDRGTFRVGIGGKRRGAISEEP